MNRRFPHYGMKPTIQRIAREYLGVETLATRNRDSLDFHDLAVWSIDKALTEAYKAGLEEQASLLHANEPVIFGNSPEAVIRSLGKQGHTEESISGVLHSCGIELKLADIGQNFILFFIIHFRTQFLQRLDQNFNWTFLHSF